MKWLDTRWPLIVMVAITLGCAFLFGYHNSPLASPFWDPNSPDSGLRGPVRTGFYILLLAWLAFGIARGIRLRQRLKERTK